MTESNLLTIKAFAKFAGVPYSTIRYYDEIGLLSPVARGEDNNYRYYAPIQLKALNFIEVLVGLGIPLAEIKEIADAREPKDIIEILGAQEIVLDRKLEDLRTAYSIIHTFRKNIEDGAMGKGGEVSIEEQDEFYYVLGPVNDFGHSENVDGPFRHFCNAANDYRINLRYPVGWYFYDMKSFAEAPSEPNKFFSLDPMGNCKREAGKYLVGYKKGYDGDFDEVIEKMSVLADRHGLFFQGPVYVVYLLDEISLADPTQYLARISVKVTKDKDCKFFTDDVAYDNCPIKELCVNPHCIT
jgi:DNA-binding transcriptional MerR regulator